MLNEVDFIKIIVDVFARLGVKVLTKINNRKILSGIAEVIGEKEKIVDITVAIDKLDKIGIDGVIKELQEKGISAEAIEKLKPLISFSGSKEDKIAFLRGFLTSSVIGLKGIEEMEFIFASMSDTNLKASELELDITLARGLNYYTGSIFEVKVNDPRTDFKSSICGGGRYDDLTGIFGLPNVSGVGISFGADRIYDVMLDLNLFPESAQNTTKVLFVNFGAAEAKYCMKLADQLRANNINTEVYPDPVKMGKQMKYADDKKIPFVCLVGSNEMANGQITVKDMKAGEQKVMDIDSLIVELNR